MKKIVSFAIALIMAVSFVGCSSGEQKVEEQSVNENPSSSVSENVEVAPSNPKMTNKELEKEISDFIATTDLGERYAYAVSVKDNEVLIGVLCGDEEIIVGLAWDLSTNGGKDWATIVDNVALASALVKENFVKLNGFDYSVNMMLGITYDGETVPILSAIDGEVVYDIAVECGY